ncbi:MAG: FGGY family carbohydrate kinase [Geminicoccaceae bacterium]|nr:FGGY family carbohydrate kinase [Geminicoccaceae bacterium]
MVGEDRPRAVLGIDVGRGKTTGVLLAEDGRILARTAVEHPPQRTRPGHAEQDPETIWSAFRSVVVRLKSSVEVDLRGLAFAGEAGGLVFLDRAGRPVRPAILGGDRRAEPEAKELVQRLEAERLYAATGRRAGPCLPAAKILWLAANAPEDAQRVAKLLTPKDYLLFRLTGEYATDASDASVSGLFGIAERAWSDAVLAALGLASELLPEVFECGDVAGRVSVAGAAETGLPEGLPVVAGGSELACAALAAGLASGRGGLAWLEPGAGILLRTERPPRSIEEPFEAACDATGGWHVLAVLPLPISPLRWLAEEVAPEWAAAARAAGAEPEEALLGEAASAPAGAGDLFYLPAVDGSGSGRPAARAAWVGLAPGHGRPALARSMIEGLGHALAERLERSRAVLLAPEELLLAGRAATSEVWRPILAAQLGLPIRPLEHGLEPARGAAMLAGIGTGLFRDAREAVARAAQPIAAPIPVDGAVAAFYAAARPRWRRAMTALAALAD